MCVHACLSLSGSIYTGEGRESIAEWEAVTNSNRPHAPQNIHTQAEQPPRPVRVCFVAHAFFGHWKNVTLFLNLLPGRFKKKVSYINNKNKF